MKCTLLSLLAPAFALAAPQTSKKSVWDAEPQGQRIIPPLTTQAVIDGAKRKEVLYGPYTVPAGGMITKNARNIEAPCKNCYVTAMFATIKYPSGKEALTSEGAWLHHTVLSGPAGPIWAAGNERPTIRLNSATNKYGIDWPSTASFTLDLMSEMKEPYQASMSITYEFIEKDSAMGALYKPIYMRWNQIGYPAPPPGKATYKSPVWTSTVDGQMLYTIGHMHDGGTNLKLFVNDKLVCDSVMFYGGREGYGTAAAPAMDAAHGGHAMKKRNPQDSHGHGSSGSFGGLHISNPGACTSFGPIKVGDKMQIEAFYDMEKYPTMAHNGQVERLMGNMRVYIGRD